MNASNMPGRLLMITRLIELLFSSESLFYAPLLLCSAIYSPGPMKQNQTCLEECLWLSDYRTTFSSTESLFYAPLFLCMDIYSPAPMKQNEIISFHVPLPSQASAPPDPKKGSCLCSLLIAVSMICSIYFVGSAFVGKQYKEVSISYGGVLLKFTFVKWWWHDLLRGF